jgi:hypothetical protein
MVKIEITSFCTAFELFFTDASEKYEKYVFLLTWESLEENLNFNSLLQLYKKPVNDPQPNDPRLNDSVTTWPREQLTRDQLTRDPMTRDQTTIDQMTRGQMTRD